MKTNEELQRAVMEEIKYDPLLNDVATEIGVTAKDGVVTLSGLVTNYSKKLAAEKAAQRVRGVKVVAVDLHITLGRSSVKSDTEIAEAIKNALKWNTAVNEDKIEVIVENGHVILDGLVDWEYQKNISEGAIEGLTGIRSITNNIEVMSRSINTRDIKKKINSAFHRSATIDASNIQIETTRNRITLKGTVRSLAEKKDAEKVAWSAPGVIAVDNRIEIETDIMV